MSGPLRRTKRSRPADSGEPLSEGQAAETEGAAPTGETPPAAPETSGGDAAPAGGSTAEPGATPALVDDDASKPAEGAPAAGDETAASATGEPPASAGDPDAETAPPSGGDPAAPSGTAAAPPTEDSDDRQEAVEAGPPRSRWRPFRRAPKPTPPATKATAPAPVLLADPDTPAGVDPVDAPMRSPAGRRGRLRRRLRYLRRARELMLRDLGGLLYEVHRSGGGSVDAHATVLGAKVQRIAGLDAEAHALETALAAPRGETVVFEPGVGGTCPSCGELYGSGARFCANCGVTLGGSAPPAPAAGTQAPAVAEKDEGERDRRAFWRRVARRPERTAPDAAAPPAGEAASPSTEDTKVMAPREGDEPTAFARPAETAQSADEPTAVAEPEPPAASVTGSDAPAEESPPRKQAGDQPPAPGDAGTGQSGGDAPGSEGASPLRGARNGRSEQHDPASGDPLVSKESRE